MNPRLQKRTTIFGTYLKTLILTLTGLVGCTKGSPCFTKIKSTSQSSIVAYRYFASNETVAILDTTRKLSLYSLYGQHLATYELQLPFTNGQDRPWDLALGIIANDSSVHALSLEGKFYRCDASGCTETGSFQLEGNSRTSILQTPSLGFVNLFSSNDSLYLIQLSDNRISSFASEDANQVLFSPTPLSRHYTGRISSNPLLSEFALTTLNTNILTLQLSYSPGSLNSSKSLWKFPFQSSLVNSSLFNDSQAYSISSSVASSLLYVAYIKMEIVSDPFNYNQTLVIRARNDMANKYLEINSKGLNFHSLAFHPSLKRIYLLTTRSDLYFLDFNDSPSLIAVGDPALLCHSLGPRFLDLEVLDPNKLVVKSLNFLAILDIDDLSSGFIGVYMRKPSFMRGMKDGINSIVVYHNSFAKLYNTDNHTFVSGLPDLGKVREVKVHQTNPRFYVLLYDSISVYTTSPNISLTTTINFSQIQSLIGPSLLLKDIKDFEIMSKSDSILSVLLYCNDINSNDLISTLLLLQEDTLGFVKVEVLEPNFQFYSLLSYPYTNGSNPTQSLLNLIGLDCSLNISYFGDTNVFSTYTITQFITPTLGNGDFPLKSSIRTLTSDYESKTFARLVGSRHISQMRFWGYNNDWFFKASNNQMTTYPLVTNSKMVGLDSIQGNAQTTHTGWFGDGNLYTTNMTMLVPSYIISNEIYYGVAYQSKASNFFYILSGEGLLYRLEHNTCAKNLTLAPDTTYFFSLCFSFNCDTCSLFNMLQCGKCRSGYRLVNQYSCSSSSCSSSGLYSLQPQQECRTVCPLDYYKTEATITGGDNECLTAQACLDIGPSSILYGNQCIDSGCPIGSTLLSRVCVLDLPDQSAFMSTTKSTIAGCNLPELYWPHYSICISPDKLPSSNYKTDGSFIFCDPDTHFYDVDTGKCTMTCNKYQGERPDIGRFCSSKAQCVNGTPPQAGTIKPRLALSMLSNDLNSPPTCDTSCPLPLYTNVMDSKCIVGPCPASLITIESNKSCIPLCSTGYYVYAANSSCLTEQQCRSISGHFTENSTWTCATSCSGSNLAIESGPIARSCITIGDCLIMGSADGGGYISEDDGTCVPGCRSNQFLESNTKYCVTQEECGMRYGGTGRVVPSTATCTSLCPIPTLISSSTNSCLTSDECVANNFKIDQDSSTCSENCPTSLPFIYQSICYLNCPIDTYLSETGIQCLGKCKDRLVTLKSTEKVCAVGIIAEMSNLKSYEENKEIEFDLSFYFEFNGETASNFSISIPDLLVNATLVKESKSGDQSMTKQALIFESIVNKSAGLYNLKYKLRESVIGSWKIELLLDESVIFTSKDMRSMISTPTVVQSIDFSSPSGKKDSSTENFRGIRTIAKGLTIFGTLIKIFTPMLMAFPISMRSGSMLCLFAQTFTKLMMMARLNFQLKNSSYSELYYEVFRDFMDGPNEALATMIMGRNTVALNKQEICESSFKKFCEMNLESNFIMSKLLEIILFAFQVAGTIIIIGITAFFGFKEFSNRLKTRFKNSMLFVFILENAIEFWFGLNLNISILKFSSTILTITKVIGILIIFIFWISLAMVLIYSLFSKKYPTITNFKMISFGKYIYQGFELITKEISREDNIMRYLMCWLLHDFLFNMILIFGYHMKALQIWIMCIFEIFLVCYAVSGQLFKEKFLMVRSIFLESSFFALSVLILVIQKGFISKSFDGTLLFYLSTFILFLDFVFISIDWVKKLISCIQKKKENRISFAKKIKIGFNEPRSLGLKFNRSLKSKNGLKKDGKELQMKSKQIIEIGVSPHKVPPETIDRLSSPPLNLTSEIHPKISKWNPVVNCAHMEKPKLDEIKISKRGKMTLQNKLNLKERREGLKISQDTANAPSIERRWVSSVVPKPPTV